MGWDITYHPIAESEICGIYFRALQDPARVAALQQQFQVHPFYMEQLEQRFEEARCLDSDVPFGSGHAFYLAVVAGHLRRYQYLRGSALSFFIDDPVVARYFADWRQLVPVAWKDAAAGNHLQQNYSGGVFIRHAQLQQLRADHAVDAGLRARLDELFSDGRLAVFWTAVDEAIASGCGLLEATEVVEPNPLDLASSTSLSNLLNCSKDGAQLYAEAATAQLAGFLAAHPPPDSPAPTSAGPARSWWARLFRR